MGRAGLILGQEAFRAVNLLPVGHFNVVATSSAYMSKKVESFSKERYHI